MDHLRTDLNQQDTLEEPIRDYGIEAPRPGEDRAWSGVLTIKEALTIYEYPIRNSDIGEPMTPSRRRDVEPSWDWP